MSLLNPPRVLSPGEVYEPAEAPAQAEEWHEDLNVTLMCPDCKELPPNLIEEFGAGDTVCASCGRVLADRIIDTRSEWRTFSNDDQGNDDPSRVGDAANPLLNGSQLQTEVGAGDGSMRSRELARAQNKSTHDKGNKALMAAFKNIAGLCESHNLPHTVADTAKHIYKMTDNDKIFKGKSQEAVIAGCVFIACRQNNVGRSFKEIFRMTNVSKKEIGKTFKTLEAHLASKRREASKTVAGNGAVLSTSNYKVTAATDPSVLIERACHKLKLPRPIPFIAQEAAARCTLLGVGSGRSPLSVMGACIYFITNLMGHPQTPKQISEAVDVSDGTIRTAYKQLYAAKEKMIVPDWIEKGGDVSRLPQS